MNMGTTALVTLILMGILAVPWAAVMLHTLWMLSKRSATKLQATGGGYFTGVGHSLATYRDFARSQQDRKRRRLLLVLTVLMFAVIILRVNLL